MYSFEETYVGIQIKSLKAELQGQKSKINQVYSRPINIIYTINIFQPKEDQASILLFDLHNLGTLQNRLVLVRINQVGSEVVSISLEYKLGFRIIGLTK